MDDRRDMANGSSAISGVESRRAAERRYPRPMPAAPTPAIAALVKARVPHTLHPYHHDPSTTAFGDEVVTALGWDPDRVFKTLVASVDGALTVGIVPVAAQLDMKALAAAAGGKKAQLAKVADAERSSGYVAGGISPLGHPQGPANRRRQQRRAVRDDHGQRRQTRTAGRTRSDEFDRTVSRKGRCDRHLLTHCCACGWPNRAG